MKMSSLYRPLSVAFLSLALFAGADWPRLRGPGASGISADTGLPITWSATENVVWKTALPGKGGSSPITWKEKIFLTAYSGYGVDRGNLGVQEDLTLHVLCINRADGKILWEQKSKALLPEQEYNKGHIDLHGYASATPVTDGEGLFVFFGRSGARAYDLAGKPLWHAVVGSNVNGWGSAASPVVCGEVVIVNASIESESLVALNKKTGKEVWRATGIRESWSTPAVVELPDGKRELVLSMHGKILGFDPATGERLWECAGVPDYVVPMTVADKGVVYVTGGRTPATVAVRAGGRGDVTKTHRLWALNICDRVSSPLVHDGLLYWADTMGMACCIKADTGEVIYKERLAGGGAFYGSMVMAEGRLYAVSKIHGAVVLAAGREFKQLARNDLGDKSLFNATPVITDGRLLLRSDRFLYCIGKMPGASTEMVLQKRYLNFPVKNGGPGRQMGITVDGKLLGRFGIRLAEDKPDWWAFIDVARFKGKKITIDMSPAPKDWNVISQDDAIKGAEDLYQEKYRPQFHFTSRRGWLNDPNGLIYYKGEYHLYYQHNPMGTGWGNMSWGHAVSKDLVHWEELPAVLFPNSTGDCFSGAAFLDRKNLLGRKTGEEDVLVMFYLRTKSGLCLAYSNDRGRTLTDYEGNPVLTHPGDRLDTPRPFWYGPTKRWIAPTYDHFKNKDGKHLRAVGIYSSENLKDWKFESRVEQDRAGDELCGCVDFFQLPLGGDANAKKWVMIFIDGSYIVGTFDGHTFYTLSGKPAVTMDRVKSLVIPGNYYATMTWENEPSGRRVQMTWMQGGRYPGMPFNQQMTVPVELTLHSTEEGPRLRISPVKELETLRAKTHEWKDLILKAGENPLAGIQGDLFDVEVAFEPVANTQTTFDLRGHKVVYDAQAQTLSSGGIRTPLKPDNGVVHLRALLDRTSIEVFGNHGRVYIPLCIIPKDDDRSLSASCGNGEVKARFLRVHELKSAWDMQYR